MAEHPEIDLAIDHIVNDSITTVEDDKVKVNLDDVNVPDNVKKTIEYEFQNALQLLEFNNKAYEIYKRWYVDGRLYYHAIIDPDNTQVGIQELRFIDPRKIRKIRETKKTRDPGTGIPIPVTAVEYYLYNEKGFYNSLQNSPGVPTSSTSGGIKIAKDAIVHVTSGISSIRGDMILSYLHKAIKPLNNLRSLEDSLVIYRISRAPERRIFYIDIGNLPKMKAEQYLRDVMARFKNKVVYDASTGEIRDDRKFMTMLEDFWLPRREGGRGTEITTLPGGQNLNQIDDIIYFQRLLFRALVVPISRLDPETQALFSNGSEVTRDELIFGKFVDRLRLKFSELFTSILEKQLVLKNIMSIEDFEQLLKPFIHYDFMRDNYFEEMKESTIITSRMNLLGLVDPTVGKYYSRRWVQKKILQMTDEEIKEEDGQIQAEIQAGLILSPAEAQLAQQP